MCSLRCLVELVQLGQPLSDPLLQVASRPVRGRLHVFLTALGLDRGGHADGRQRGPAVLPWLSAAALALVLGSPARSLAATPCTATLAAALVVAALASARLRAASPRRACGGESAIALPWVGGRLG